MIEKNNLLTAVLKRSVTQVQNCILDGEDLNFKDENGRNYLHLSVIVRSEDLVEYFINEGLDVNESDNEHISPLHRACRNGSDKIVTRLLNCGADPNIKAENSITPLHVAAAFGHLGCVRSLLKVSGSRIDVSPKDSEYHTPLHYAAAEGHKEIATELIGHGCDTTWPNICGNTPIHFAAASGTPELCHILSTKVDLDVTNSKGQTALHLATLQSCVNTVCALIHLQANPNIRDNEGNTCLHLAFKSGHIELVSVFMMDDRTDPSICDDEQNTVLHLALKLGHFNLVPIMLPRARDLTRQNSSGCTVIIEAIKNQLEELAIDMLKVCPSLVHTATLDLVTPLHLAAERGMTQLTRELLIAGAQVDATDASGLTPSLYCAKNDSVLECLAMIEDIMLVPETHIEENGHRQHVSKGNGSRISSRISS